VSNDLFNRENQLTSSIEKIKRVQRLNQFDQVKYREAFTTYASIQPLHKRVSNPELAYLLEREFKDKQINLPYQFGIFNDGLATKVTSNNFQELSDSQRYVVPIFTDKNGVSPYELAVIFPDKNRYVFSSIFGVAGLSLFLSLFIILVSTSALYQIIRQKKISEIKTDFINNMTHEFKTPIATINLALDAMGNAKVIKTPEAILRYATMIREENNRMLTQVENVLRISQLERSTAPIDKTELDLHALIDEAISHVALIVEDRKGYIKTHLSASDAVILANQNHFVNVLVNVLDNAIKYSEGAPKIDVYTDVTPTHVSLTIKDNGIGMDQNTQKHIFEKFYREQGGNIHNIKGHGLGLSYVKRIVDLHEGKIQIESKKGKGTSFSIFLPLIHPMT
jgi:two-component system phosphate regulon sensor histidine kinase PhoR